MAENSTLALLFSGGIDSAVLLSHQLAQGRQVQPLYIDSGLVWQEAELRAAQRYLDAVACDRLSPLVVLQLPLADLLAGHWCMTGRGVPDAASPDEAVYLPGRNPLLLVKADLWCRLHDVHELALGSLKSNPFADATDEFFFRFTAALDCAASGRVRIVRPLAELDKRQVMQLGRSLPLELTFSCLAPVAGEHCGQCNKCAERQHAFKAIHIHSNFTKASQHDVPSFP